MTSVTVMGGGVFGLACAWECLRRGARVRVIEVDRIGAGSSGGTVGALAPHVPENWNEKKAFQLESLKLSEPFWAGVAQAGGVDPGYARTGRVQPLVDEPTVARWRERLAGAARYWPEWARMWISGDGAPMGLRSPTGLFLHDTLTARMSPRAAGAALAAAIRAQGGEITEGVRDAQPDGTVIWATGAAGLSALSDDLGRSVGNGVKGQSALLAYAAPDLPQVFADAVHIVPHADGTVGVGSTSERVFADGGTVDDQLEALIAKAREICPALTNAPVVDRWAGVRPRAASRAPLLGAWPGRPGHFVANGGFKIGFGMTPKVAAVMADLVLDGRDAIPEGFRLTEQATAR